MRSVRTTCAHRGLTLAVLTGLTVPGCSGPQTVRQAGAPGQVAPERYAPCPDPELAGESLPAAERLTRTQVSWLDAASATTGRSVGNNEAEVRLQDARGVGRDRSAAADRTLRVHQDVTDALSQLPAGRRLLVGVIGGQAVMTAVLTGNGQARFVGPCEQQRLRSRWRCTPRPNAARRSRCCARSPRTRRGSGPPTCSWTDLGRRP